LHEHHLVTARRARYYTIGGDGALLEAWIVLHGLSQLAAVFITYFETIATPERLVVAPEGLSRYYIAPDSSGGTRNAKVGATWMTREDRENEIADYVDYLDALHVKTAATAPHVTVLGFSQGVATACRWIARGKSRVDRLVAWGGQIPADVDAQAFHSVRDGVVLAAGDSDEYASWIAEGDHENRLRSAGVPFEVVTFEGGHRLDREALTRIAGV
jgi:predicted esterase